MDRWTNRCINRGDSEYSNKCVINFIILIDSLLFIIIHYYSLILISLLFITVDSTHQFISS